MPVFINEVVIRTSVDRAEGQGAATAAPVPPDKEALVAEVTRALMDYLERELDRIGER
jgi:phenylpyruvate tautomerase PptA (4-oxalocrotonate tautomerase family)